MADGDETTDSNWKPSPFLAKRVSPVWQHRIKLQEKFFQELYEDFEVYGKEALERCRRTKPDKYLAIIAQLMPKQIEQQQPLEGLSDDELLGAVAVLRERIAAGAFALGTRGNETHESTALVVLPAVSEAAAVP